MVIMIAVSVTEDWCITKRDPLCPGVVREDIVSIRIGFWDFITPLKCTANSRFFLQTGTIRWALSFTQANCWPFRQKG